MSFRIQSGLSRQSETAKYVCRNIASKHYPSAANIIRYIILLSDGSELPPGQPAAAVILDHGAVAERDRDDAGHARNARPRDRFGRPLPFGSPGIERIPDDLDLTPDQTLDYAQRLLDDGLAFNAHEVLEAAWKNGPFAERMLWQGLAQYAVGITHLQRGNPKGARTLLERAVSRLEASIPWPYGIDGAALMAYGERLLADIDAGRDISPDSLHPRLRG